MGSRTLVAAGLVSRRGGTIGHFRCNSREARCLTLPRFLIDENLSVKLSEAAHRRGFEATHIVHLGLGKWKDWNILEVVEQNGWILVTNNAMEFRSRYRRIEIHPGVVFLR